MQLSPEQVAEFQSIYKDVFDESISSQTAYEMGIDLVQLIQLIYKPMRRDEYNRILYEMINIRKRV